VDGGEDEGEKFGELCGHPMEEGGDWPNGMEENGQLSDANGDNIENRGRMMMGRQKAHNRKGEWVGVGVETGNALPLIRNETFSIVEKNENGKIYCTYFYIHYI
jgi:hypothetical protein